jgi:hypothetical protein
MAYPTICPECQAGAHGHCSKRFVEEREAVLRENPDLIGGPLCVCAHGGPESKFQKNVRERVERERS